VTTHASSAGRTMHPTAGWILPIGVGQVVVWQLAVLGALAFPAGGAGLVAILVAMLVVGLTSVRTGGLHAVQWLVIYVRFHFGRRAVDRVAATPVRTLLPNLHVHTHVDRAGNRVGIASIDENVDYSVTLRLTPPAHPDPASLISLLRTALDRPDLPLTAAQLVVWTVPYSPAPVTVHWLALRYRRGEAPVAAAARGGGPDGGRRAIATAALRLSAELSSAGYANSVLDTPELHRELLVAVGGPASHRAGERWHDYAIAGIRQACFLPRHPDDVIPLLGRHAPTAVFTCTSYTLTRTPAPRAIATVRLGLPAQSSPRAVAARLHPRLSPANGRHRNHLLATLPLALVP
jgi:type VII secretion protein EccE